MWAGIHRGHIAPVEEPRALYALVPAAGDIHTDPPVLHHTILSFRLSSQHSDPYAHCADSRLQAASVPSNCQVVLE